VNTYEIRASRITYDFYEIKANSLEEAEQRALCRTDKVNTLTTVSTVDYCREFSWVVDSEGVERRKYGCQV